jgi:hypothetical protein
VPKETGGEAEFAIAIGDANNDGLEDVFCGTFTSPYKMIILLSDGNGGLSAQPGVSPGGRPWQAVTGDFNGDGNMDVATSNSQSNNMGVLYGDGLGGFLAAATVLGTDSFPLAIDAGDVDGDGDLELFVSCYSGGTWNLFENVAGTLTNRKILAASTAGSEAVMHDRDNDGDLDITGIDEIDDYVYYFTNNGPATAAGPVLADAARLAQNAPNPFNPSTSIRFELVAPGDVDLSVYDAAGAFVVRLAHGHHAAGGYEVRWSGLDAGGARVASGLYFCRLAAGDAVLTRKMVLLK